MTAISEAYRPRPIRFLGLWELAGFRLKVYGITYSKADLDGALMRAARRAVEERLYRSAAATNHYGVGFAGVHQGKTGNFVFVDWWADENELHHHVYVSASEDPARLDDVTPTGLAACVWDLAVIGHERRAWIDHVLMRADNPDWNAYLSARIHDVV